MDTFHPNVSDSYPANGCGGVDGSHWTGSGYYAGVVLDPDGNLVQITVWGRALIERL